MKSFKKNNYTKRSAGFAFETLIVSEVDKDGDMWGSYVKKGFNHMKTRVLIMPNYKGHNPDIGDKILAKIIQSESYLKGHIIRILDPELKEIIGEYTTNNGQTTVVPLTRRSKIEFIVDRKNLNIAKPGQIVIADILPNQYRFKRLVKIREVLGDLNSSKTITEIALREYDIPSKINSNDKISINFDPEKKSHYRDLTDIPFVTIDPEDAKDFDDAIWAIPNKLDGWKIRVAIADVAAYVEPGSSIDLDAKERGNSIYFPGDSIPMLPIELSNDTCSLKENKKRLCIICEFNIDKIGNINSKIFYRATIKSYRRFTYKDAQEIYSSRTKSTDNELLTNLWKAYLSLKISIKKRCPLEIQSKEFDLLVNKNGFITKIEPKKIFESHKLVESYMITANICAAEMLKNASNPCIFRVHAIPEYEKLHEAKNMFNSLGIPFNTSGKIKPIIFNKVLEQYSEKKGDLINQITMRTQSQAHYSIKNIGHFGLALSQYIHFTSPIRRYADLLIHRLLISFLELGHGGIEKISIKDAENTSKHISLTERRAVVAERDVSARLIAIYLSSHLKKMFMGRVNGFSKTTIYVTLDEFNIDVLIPFRTLNDDYYSLNKNKYYVSGKSTKRRFSLGDRVKVQLVETDVRSGKLIAHIK